MHETELMLKCVVIARYSVNILYILFCLILVLQTLLSFYIGLFSWYFFFGHPLFTYAQIKDNFPPYNVFHQKSLLKIHVKSFKSQYAQFFYFWKILFLSVTSVGISVGWLQRSPDRTGKKREKFKVDRVIFLGVGAHSFKA